MVCKRVLRQILPRGICNTWRFHRHCNRQELHRHYNKRGLHCLDVGGPLRLHPRPKSSCISSFSAKSRMPRKTRRLRGGSNNAKENEVRPAAPAPASAKSLTPLTDAFAANPSTHVKRLSTYLRIIGEENPEFDSGFDIVTKKFNKPLSVEQLLRYEAFLGQCAFLSRLAYSPTDIFLQAMQKGMEYTQTSKNNVLEMTEYLSYGKKNKYSEWFYTPDDVHKEAVHGKDVAQKAGKFFPVSGCTIIQWKNPNSKINNKSTLFVVCKGSSALSDFGTDFQAVSTTTSSLYGLNNVPGSTHRGFISHISVEINLIIETIKNLSKDFQQIVFTGHSLGGASATLIAFVCGMMKRDGRLPLTASLHLITFGAPMVFTEATRNVFNELLLDGTLTFDRVVATGDNITNMPGIGYSHPGFRILKAEAAMQKMKLGFGKSIFDKTGRSGYIRHIRRLAVGDNPDLKDELNDNKIIKENLPGFDIYDKTDVRGLQLPKEAQEAVAKLDAAAEKAAPVAPSEEGGTTEGGGPSTDIYKTIAKNVYPNTVNYNCANKAGLLTGLGCHVSYMGIGFMGALRLPVIPQPPFFMRKKEPTEITDLVSYDGTPSPSVRVVVLHTGNELNLEKAIAANKTIPEGNRANMLTRMTNAVKMIQILPTNTRELVYGKLKTAATKIKGVSPIVSGIKQYTAVKTLEPVTSQIKATVPLIQGGTRRGRGRGRRKPNAFNRHLKTTRRK
jgi:hypothetical protein